MDLWLVSVWSKMVQKTWWTVIHVDHCFYTRRNGNSITIFSVYVDDILFATKNDPIEMNKIKDDLQKWLCMKHLGPFHYCLGVEFKQNLSNGIITMKQSRCICEILDCFGITDWNSVTTPLNYGEVIRKISPGEKIDGEFPYQNLKGSLMYLASSVI